MLRFGYLTQNSALDTAIATTSGIDDWSVTIPEPHGLALLAVSFLALARQRRPI